MNTMRVVFMGTPDFAVPSLKALLAADYEVVAVFTQPDRPRGRGQKVTYSPVKHVALEAGLPVHQPARLREPSVVQSLERLAPDVIVVVAFGQLLPAAVLSLPALGCINVHASLLPKYRGAAPIQAALVAGEDVTGVTTMHMDEGLDTGDIILQRPVAVGPADDASVVHDRLAAAGSRLLTETLHLLALGEAPRVPQTDAEATYAPRLSRDAGHIDWQLPARDVHNRVRAYTPWPGAFTMHEARRLKVVQTELVVGEDADGAENGAATGSAEPGRIVALTDVGFYVATGGGQLHVLRVQPPNRAAMSGRDYANGYGLRAGDVLRPVE